MKHTQATIYRKTAVKKKVVGNVIQFSPKYGWREFAKHRRWCYVIVDEESIHNRLSLKVIRILFSTTPLPGDARPCSTCISGRDRLRILLPETLYDLDLPTGKWLGSYRRDREYPPGQFDYVVTLQRTILKDSPVGRGI